MAERVYISANNTATFVCPVCQRDSTVDVSQYAVMDKTIRVKSKCPCGNAWTSILEKRQQFRKDVSLPGTFKRVGATDQLSEGNMVVVDLSMTGLKLKMSFAPPFNTGDLLDIAFQLDDKRRTSITKKVKVMNVSGPYVGVAFLTSDPPGAALGFYLM